VLRERFRQPRPALTQPSDLHRDLGDYDRAFGITLDDGQVA
jgi:hypothetical protein